MKLFISVLYYFPYYVGDSISDWLDIFKNISRI